MAVQVLQGSEPTLTSISKHDVKISAYEVSRPLEDPRIELKAKFVSQPFYIPNLQTLYRDWPRDVNPNYSRLKVALDERIKAIYPLDRATSLMSADFSLLAAMWWPIASAERLQTCAFCLIWLFTWDDEIDQSTSALSTNLRNANAFRHETYHFARHVLGVPNEETLAFKFEENAPASKLIRSLDIIGAELQRVYNKDQIMVFVDEIYYYMGCQKHEQSCKLIGVMPTVEEYWETRLGTSAATSMLALNEYADTQTIPRWIMTHPKMLDIWKEVNMNMSLCNDMLSLRKEIKHGDVDSIIPVLVFNRGLAVQEAIQDTCEELRNNIERHDQSARDLLDIVRVKDPGRVDEVARYVVGCRYNQTANLLWSLETTRYGLGNIPRDSSGGMTIVIEPNDVDLASQDS